MRLNSTGKISLSTGLLSLLIFCACYAQPELFQGRITGDNTNIRGDSTVNSKIICILNKGEPVQVIKESYEWYKIRLPKTVAAFIRRDLISAVDEKTAMVTKDNVNIRLEPSESSVILGRAGKNEIVNIIERKEGWYKIEPTGSTFGWVHKQFVAKDETVIGKSETDTAKTVAAPLPKDIITVEGTLSPYGKVIRRVATNKLITDENKVFLLKGNKKNLDSLNYHRVKVTGKLIQPENQKYSTIEVQKLEALD